MKKIIILVNIVLIVIVLTEFLYLLLLPSIKKRVVQKQDENLSIKKECGDLILNSRWKNILEERLTSYIYLSKIEDIQFDKTYGSYFYPLIINLNKEQNLSMSFTKEEWQKMKIYSLNNNNLIPYDYKKLKKGDEIKIQITTSILKNDSTSLKEIIIVKVD